MVEIKGASGSTNATTSKLDVVDKNLRAYTDSKVNELADRTSKALKIVMLVWLYPTMGIAVAALILSIVK